MCRLGCWQMVTSNPFLFHDYKKGRHSFLFEFLQQCLLIQGLFQDLFHRHLKNVKNNHNTLLELTFLLTSISFKVRYHNKHYSLKSFTSTIVVRNVSFSPPFFYLCPSFHLSMSIFFTM